MTNTNKILVALAIVILIGLSIGIASSAAQKAKVVDRGKDLAAGLGTDGKGGFNPQPYTDSLYADCYDNYKCDTDLYDDLIKLSDENIKAIFLDWTKRYQSKKDNKNRSLAKAIYYAYTGLYPQWTWGSYVQPFYDKLIALGLE